MLTKLVNDVLKRKKAASREPFNAFAGWSGPVEIPSLEDVAQFIRKHFPSPTTDLGRLDATLRGLSSFRAVTIEEVDGAQWLLVHLEVRWRSVLLAMAATAAVSPRVYTIGKVSLKELSREIRGLDSYLLDAALPAEAHAGDGG